MDLPTIYEEDDADLLRDPSSMSNLLRGRQRIEGYIGDGAAGEGCCALVKYICWHGSVIKSVGSAHGMQIKDLLVELIPSRPKF